MWRVTGFDPQHIRADGPTSVVSPVFREGGLRLLPSSRCLDEAEEALRPAAQIPGCPVCGKPFLTLKSRISHLKQCAVKMEIGPQLLLQAVRLQAAQLEGACSPPVSR